jgi:hypothetical protein
LIGKCFDQGQIPVLDSRAAPVFTARISKRADFGHGEYFPTEVALESLLALGQDRVAAHVHTGAAGGRAGEIDVAGGIEADAKRPPLTCDAMPESCQPFS